MLKIIELNYAVKLHAQFARISRFLFSWTLKCSKRSRDDKEVKLQGFVTEFAQTRPILTLLGQVIELALGGCFRLDPAHFAKILSLILL